MSSYHPPAGPPTRNGEPRHNGHSHGSDGSHSYDSYEGSYEDWAARSRLVVTPIAAPSILGLFGFAGATFMVASNLAGWWGNSLLSPVIIAPFAIFFGGLAQLLAGMWSYRARDGVATAMHGTWGAFWLAWGMTALMAANGLLPPNVFTTQAFGFWWIVLAVVTLFGALAALAENMALFLVLILLAAGSSLLAAGLISPSSDLVNAAGWVLVAASAAAFYTAGAMMLKSAFKGRVILPVGEWSMRGNLPGHRAVRPISYPMGEPGTKVGQ
ncbi:acetate uptake transporter [Streptomyces sp. NRRL F-5126]|uniref:acetate uptake transporter n=1 Tax=Streptomyces sp. NRRL F-5126 TaxID=1463857 RepID=UPI00068B9461|nr:GPR1/FUN34/YaaH family transporter [Streptomyces sp. NRRL F-5126]